MAPSFFTCLSSPVTPSTNHHSPTSPRQRLRFWNLVKTTFWHHYHAFHLPRVLASIINNGPKEAALAWRLESEARIGRSRRFPQSSMKHYDDDYDYMDD